MTRKIIFGLISTVVFSVVGLFIGINIGGNYFPNFVFMGGKGYEATGYLGSFLGAIFGLISGILLEKQLRKKDRLL